MTGEDHVITSVSATVIVAGFAIPSITRTDPLQIMTLAGSVGIGALMPDLDSANSIISQQVGRFFAAVFTHRGFLHSIFAWGLWTYFWYWLLNSLFDTSWTQWMTNFSMCLWLGLSLGYLMHLIEDSFSVAGVRWLNPFSARDDYVWNKYHTLLRPVDHFEKDDDGHSIPCRHRWGRGYVTGSDEETGIAGAFLLGAIIAIIKLVFF